MFLKRQSKTFQSIVAEQLRRYGSYAGVTKQVIIKNVSEIRYKCTIISDAEGKEAAFDFFRRSTGRNSEADYVDFMQVSWIPAVRIYY